MADASVQDAQMVASSPLPTVTVPFPWLPVELVYLILEDTACLDKNAAATLCRVSSTVQTIVEPILRAKWKEIISLEDISFYAPDERTVLGGPRVMLRGLRVLSAYDVDVDRLEYALGMERGDFDKLYEEHSSMLTDDVYAEVPGHMKYNFALAPEANTLVRIRSLFALNHCEKREDRVHFTKVIPPGDFLYHILPPMLPSFKIFLRDIQHTPPFTSLPFVKTSLHPCLLVVPLIGYLRRVLIEFQKLPERINVDITVASDIFEWLQDPIPSSWFGDHERFPRRDINGIAYYLDVEDDMKSKTGSSSASDSNAGNDLSSMMEVNIGTENNGGNHKCSAKRSKTEIPKLKRHKDLGAGPTQRKRKRAESPAQLDGHSDEGPAWNTRAAKKRRVQS